MLQRLLVASMPHLQALRSVLVSGVDGGCERRLRAARGMSLLLALAAFVPHASAAPEIFENGVVNAASFVAPVLPGGSIAQGSFFSGFGAEMGPVAGVANNQLPLPTELGGVRVTVRANGVDHPAYLTFVRAGQFNAVMPSDVPVGPAEIRVSFGGQTSAPRSVKIAASSFGIFSVRQTGSGPGVVNNFVSDAVRPLNTVSVSAMPNQVVTIWGTGLVGLPGADDRSPLAAGVVGDRQGQVQVSVLVGGVPVHNILYAGRSAEFPGIDQISVTLGPNTLLGCFVPLLVVTNGAPSNEVTIATSANGGPCEDPLNPISSRLISGARLGALANVRLVGEINLSAALGIDFTLDVMAGTFSDQVGGATAYNRYFALPPMGSCSRQIFRGINLLDLLGGNFPDLDFGPELNAGPSLKMTRNGADERVIVQDAQSVGRYVDTVGGGLALVGPADPAYYDPGNYRIVGVGGADVGAIDVNFTIPARPAWVNRDAVVGEDGKVDRDAGLPFTWDAGGQSSQTMVVLAANVDIDTGAASGVICLVPQNLGGMTIPPALMAGIPVSTPPDDFSPTSLGIVGFGSLPLIQPFQAQGLDLGVAIAATIEVQSATFE